MKWILGDGQTIRVWKHYWILRGTLHSRIAEPLMPNEEQQLLCFLQNNHAWTLDFLHVPLPMQLE